MSAARTCRTTSLWEPLGAAGANAGELFGAATEHSQPKQRVVGFLTIAVEECLPPSGPSRQHHRDLQAELQQILDWVACAGHLHIDDTGNLRFSARCIHEELVGVTIGMHESWSKAACLERLCHGLKQPVQTLAELGSQFRSACGQ